MSKNEHDCNEFETENFVSKNQNDYENDVIFDDEVNSVENLAGNSLFNIECNDNSPYRTNIYVKIKIDNKEYDFMLDSGSSISACSYENYLKYFSGYRLTRDATVLRGYSGEAFTPEGHFLPEVTYRDRT